MPASPAPRRFRPFLALTATVVAGAVALSACSSDPGTPGPTITVTRTPASTPATSAAPSTDAAGSGSGSGSGSVSASAPTSASASPTPTKTKPTGAPVKVISSVLDDGSQVGVGLPIILLLSRPITDARAFAAATTVTVNGNPVHGAWYFETKFGATGFPIEADYRTEQYWPGHAQIHFDLKAKGKSAGTGLVFANNLSLDFSTGAANILTVSNAKHTVRVMSDGKLWGTFPTSLGATKTPTKRGTKVIMEKGVSICMSGPGYHECGVQFTQRLTYDGEYLHAAPWNTYNIAHGINSSNGCTNLYTADAKKLYYFLEIGDVVKYPDADGPQMGLGDGYGDWNVPWSQWLTGGLYRTT